MACVVLLGSLLLITARVSGADVDPAMPFSEYLDLNHDVLLRWGFDVMKDTILFELSVKSTGWVSLGFSPDGGMTGADIVIGGISSGGMYFMDMYAVGNVMPSLDREQDYKLISLTETDGQTVMKFQRFIGACQETDFPITEVPIKLIYAYGDTDNVDYHGPLRGTKEVNLLRYMPRASIPDSNYFDLTMTNFTVPATTTTYHCKIMRLPALDKKYHVYRIEPVIGNPDLVHHMLLYRCPSEVTQPSESPCYTRNEKTCFHAVAVWGVGGGAFELPEVAGIPVGGEGTDVFYRLEIHYNNPHKTAGRVDNSGLRFYYTAQLRQYDATVLQTGLAATVGNTYAIPPNATSFLTYGLCDTGYFSQVLTETPRDMQVFAAILHTYLAGRKVRVGHFRNGEQIDFLALNERYDFEFQQVTQLGKTKTVKVGDKLLVECTYDTQNRTGLTWGGLGTENEMCLAFFYYYPAMELSSCASLPNTQALRTAMGAVNTTDWLNIMNKKRWDNSSILDYQQTLTAVQQNTLVMNTVCSQDAAHGALSAGCFWQVDDSQSSSDSENDVVIRTGNITELRASPRESCLRSGSEIQRPATRILLPLVWATLALVFF